MSALIDPRRVFDAPLVSSEQTTRRDFLKISGVMGGGLMLAAAVPGWTQTTPQLVGGGDLNAYVQIKPDGSIVIYSGSPEMGQGIATSLPMIVAEEMGADWADVVVQQTPEVNTERYGRQSTGGSYTVYLNWQLMREMGASAREMLISAAAIVMELPRDELQAEDSRVRHLFSNRSRSFAELASLAQDQPIPAKADLVFRAREDYRIIGTSKSQVDSFTSSRARAISVSILGCRICFMAVTRSAPRWAAKLSKQISKTSKPFLVWWMPTLSEVMVMCVNC